MYLKEKRYEEEKDFTIFIKLIDFVFKFTAAG